MLGRKLSRLGRVGDDIEANRIDALDDWRVGAARQAGRYIGDSGFDRACRLVRIDIEIETDRRRRNAVADRGRNVMHAGDAGNRRLDLAGDAILKFVGGAPKSATMTDTTGGSMLGSNVIGNCRKLMMPSVSAISASPMTGIGLRIASAETLSDTPRFARSLKRFIQ